MKTMETVLRCISYGKLYISTIKYWEMLTSYKIWFYLCSKIFIPKELSKINHFWERTHHSVFWMTKVMGNLFF